jgi:hypothetical protein
MTSEEFSEWFQARYFALCYNRFNRDGANCPERNIIDRNLMQIIFGTLKLCRILKPFCGKAKTVSGMIILKINFYTLSEIHSANVLDDLKT